MLINPASGVELTLSDAGQEGLADHTVPFLVTGGRGTDQADGNDEFDHGIATDTKGGTVRPPGRQPATLCALPGLLTGKVGSHARRSNACREPIMTSYLPALLAAASRTQAQPMAVEQEGSIADRIALECAWYMGMAGTMSTPNSSVASGTTPSRLRSASTAIRSRWDKAA